MGSSTNNNNEDTMNNDQDQNQPTPSTEAETSPASLPPASPPPPIVHHDHNRGLRRSQEELEAKRKGRSSPSSTTVDRPVSLTGSSRMKSSTSTISNTSSSTTGLSEKGLRNNAPHSSAQQPPRPGALRVGGHSTSVASTTATSSNRGLRQNSNKAALMKAAEHGGVSVTSNSTTAPGASAGAAGAGLGGKSGRGLSSKKNLTMTTITTTTDAPTTTTTTTTTSGIGGGAGGDLIVGGKHQHHKLGMIHHQQTAPGLLDGGPQGGEGSILSTVQRMPAAEEPQAQQPGAHPVDHGRASPPEVYGDDEDEDEDVDIQEEEIHVPTTRSSFDLETGGGSGNLVEARAVEPGQGSSILLPEAQEVSKQQLEAKEFKKYKEKECRRTGYVIIGVSLLILAIGLGVGLTKQNNNKTTVIVVEPTTTTTPPVPTMAPTPGYDPMAMLWDRLPSGTQTNIEIWDTPQRKAFDWLKGHKNITYLEEWRKTQLFALATFYFSFEGPRWLEKLNVELDWLDQDLNECFWFSGEHGTLCDEQGYKEGARHGVDACNDNGEFYALSKVCMQMEGLKPTMPPEIALLTSLSIIELAENNIQGNVMDMLPSEIFEMSSLTKLYIEGNELTGTIPTRVGLFPALWKLDIFNNQLTGTIPTQVGNIPTLVRLKLANNSLTGTIPTQLGLPNYRTGPGDFGTGVAVHTIDLSNNQLTGRIPTQFGNLNTTEWLHLQNNSFTGHVPSELGRMTWLRELFLDSNPLSGSLPSQLGLLSLMETLDLSDLPHLTGSIPSELFQQMPLLGFVNLLQDTTSSLLSGTIPEELCYLQEPYGDDNTTSSCIYDSLSSWHNGTNRDDPSDCSLLFDCSSSSLICGCNCDCTTTTIP